MLGLVLGGGRGVLAEAQRLYELMAPAGPDIIVIVNLAGLIWPGRADHWVSIHGRDLPLWAERRRQAGHPPAGAYWTTRSGELPRSLRVRVIPIVGGSSGRVAVEVLLGQLEAERVVLCGVPMTPTPHEEGLGPAWKGRAWSEALAHRAAWEHDLPRLQQHVRSMSGWTQEMLGAPTQEWLRGETS